jgi:hypothetical protein
VSDATETVPRSLGMLAVAAVLAAITALLAIRMPRALESFRGLFQGFGVEVSAVTKLAIRSGPVWWLFAIASVAVFVWVAARSQPSVVEYRRMKIAVRTVITLTVLAYGFAAAVLYGPIFKLGAVV